MLGSDQEIVDRALRSPGVVLSLMGPSGGETTEQILVRKADDISRIGRTAWAIHSWKATPDQVRRCEPEFLLLIGDPPRRLSGGAGLHYRDAGVPAAGDSPATHYRAVRQGCNGWTKLSDGLSPVTTNWRYLKGGNGRALILKSLIDLRNQPKTVQMADFADISGGVPIPMKTGQGFSTVCAQRRDMRGHPDVWRKERLIIAVGEFIEPNAVWLR